jgi:signal transduction histidine kinase
MDIRFVLRKSSVYLASLISVLIPYLVVKFIFYSLVPDTVYWADFLMLIIALALFPGLKDYYFRLANKYFFSSLYDSRKVIAQLSDKLKATLETRKIFEIISGTMIESMRVKEVSMFSYNTRLKRYILQNDKKTEMNIDVKKDFSAMAEKIISDHSHPIIIEEIKRIFYKDNKEAIDFFNSSGVEILVPLNVKDKKIGLIVLGQKESGDIYNDEDMEVLNVIGSQAAIALENALLYEETASFNIKLKKEIERATSDLRSANEELKKLDEAKSEFISIASHQLRTPLTAIKGYVSMILEGDFGKPAVKNVPPLKNVFESSERLIKLIENLLNISRIESGRIKYEFKIIQLEDMVASVISELEQVAQKKNIKLIYKSPAKPLPKIKVDEEKIRQVVMNIIDNAVKYTNAGSVEVRLGLEENNIKFCVSDTGMGIKKEDLPNLFKKFSRGSGTFLVHTEGTGLGLYVARQMIEMHKGKVWAESEGEGKGSSFIFLLPVAGKKME